MTLAEVLIASSILVVCLTALAAVLGGVITSSSMARSRDEATNLANSRLEMARSLPYDSVGVRYADGSSGEPSGTILTPEQVGRYLVTTECSWVQAADGRAAYKRLKVTVAWTSPVPGKVEVNTIIYGKSGITGTGDFVVKLRYRENSDPVVDTVVTFTGADNIARQLTTDSAGEVVFGRMPVGACTIGVAAPVGYIVDGTTLTNTAVSGDAVSTAIVYVQRPVSATVRVLDMAGAGLAGATVAIRRSDGAVTASAVSAADGSVVFGQLLYGDYTATVTRTGYASASLPFSIAVGSTSASLDFRMSPASAYGIRTRVFDVNGTQVPNATVTLQAQDGSTVLQGSTGSNGEIMLSPPVAGTYIVLVAKSGYVSQSKTVTLQVTEEFLADFYMSAAETKGHMHLLTTGKNGKLQSLRVVVSGPGGYFSNSQYSDVNGELWLRYLVPGSYAVQIYNDSGSAVTAIINAGQIADVSVSQRN